MPNMKEPDYLSTLHRMYTFAFFKLELEIACGRNHKVCIHKFSDILVNIKAAG